MAITKDGIIQLLPNYPAEDVEKFAAYCYRLQNEKDKDWKLKNDWFQKRTNDDVVPLFKRVSAEWLVFDWIHITFQKTWVTYDYVAYKNKMFTIYPESVVDVSLVYKDDKFSVSKESWKVTYTHDIADPFKRNELDIVWAYAVIKNKRGEFITTLSSDELAKHRKVAKTDFIWKAWFSEMCMKTIIKKACKIHFADIYQVIEEMDNENYDLSKQVDDYMDEINEIKTVDELKKYWESNRWKWKDFDRAISEHKKLLLSNTQ